MWVVYYSFDPYCECGIVWFLKKSVKISQVIVWCTKCEEKCWLSFLFNKLGTVVSSTALFSESLPHNAEVCS